MDYAMMNSESSENSPVDAGMPGFAGFGQPIDEQMLTLQFQKFPPVVTVKNTFIDGWAEEDEHGVPMVSAKSCPAPKSHILEEESDAAPPRFACLLGRLPADAPAKAHRLAVQYLPNPSPDAMPAYVWPQRLAAEFCHHSAEGAQEPDPKPVVQVAARKLPPHVTPLERRGPETSLGSDLHEAGECRPCAWFWRPQGCNNGQDCRHCHLCDQGEVKVRRKSKLVSLRKQGRAAQRAQKERAPATADGVASSQSSDSGDGARPLQLTSLV